VKQVFVMDCEVYFVFLDVHCPVFSEIQSNRLNISSLLLGIFE